MPAVSQMPHLFGRVDPPAAVREGSDGTKKLVNILSFLSYWMRAKGMSQPIHVFAMSQRTVYGG
jgi:hypothetical protein